MTPLTLALALVSPADACGGFFCNGQDPVDQAGEVVVFDVDEDDELVTMHVKVQYEGPADQFSWVVPVPANPETFISPAVLFTELDARTGASFSTSTDYGACDEPYYSYSDYTASSDVADSGGSDPGVEVVSTGRVGPYDQAVLRANDADALVTWLQDNGYFVPDAIGDTLAPYLGPDTHFLALKLTKGKDTGDLEPLGLTYAGTEPAIPIGLTAVAATDDMPMRIYLLGDERAVPLNYLHVQINPLAMPWFSFGLDWVEAIGEAADEAGGHAFATTFAGTGVSFDLGGDRFDLVGLDQVTVALAWFQELDDRGFSGTDELLDILRIHVPAPDGVDETSFYNWPDDYADAWADLDATFDPVAATADLDAGIVQPRLAAQAIVDANSWITRLETQISPDEMTVDPRFGFNPDLPAVERTRRATLEYTTCGQTGSGTGGHEYEGSLRVLELPTGHRIGLPAENDMTMTDSGYLQDMIVHYGLIVEQLGTEGPGEVIADHTSELDLLEDATNPEIGPGGRPTDPSTGGTPGVDLVDEQASTSGGCGCASAEGSSTWLDVVTRVVRRR